MTLRNAKDRQLHRDRHQNDGRGKWNARPKGIWVLWQELHVDCHWRYPRALQLMWNGEVDEVMVASGAVVRLAGSKRVFKDKTIKTCRYLSESNSDGGRD